MLLLFWLTILFVVTWFLLLAIIHALSGTQSGNTDTIRLVPIERSESRQTRIILNINIPLSPQQNTGWPTWLDEPDPVVHDGNNPIVVDYRHIEKKG